MGVQRSTSWHAAVHVTQTAWCRTWFVRPATWTLLFKLSMFGRAALSSEILMGYGWCVRSAGMLQQVCWDGLHAITCPGTFLSRECFSHRRPPVIVLFRLHLTAASLFEECCVRGWFAWPWRGVCTLLALHAQVMLQTLHRVLFV